MNAFARRRACPALSAPMLTGDGLLVRLSPLDSGLSPAALAGLCGAALRHGNGVVEITGRGSLQIRGLTPQSAVLLADDVARLGIRVRAGVPVDHGVLAGLDPDEIADPRPLAGFIRAAVVEAGLERRLGPKVSVVVDGGSRSGLGPIASDIRLTAVRHAPRPLWKLAIAGDATTATSLATLAEDTAAEAAVACLDAVASLGPGGRARDLDPDALAPIAALQRDLPIMHPSVRPRNPGSSILPLRGGAWSLAAALPFGHMDARDLSAFASAALELGTSEIRPAPARTILALCTDETAARALRLEAARIGLLVDPSDPRASITACPGAPACASGRLPARVLAARIALAHADILDGSLDVHVSGCAKGCARPGAAALTLVGQDVGACLVVDGTARDTPVAIVRVEQALECFGRAADLFRAERRPAETTAECAVRLGARRLSEAFEEG